MILIIQSFIYEQSHLDFKWNSGDKCKMSVTSLKKKAQCPFQPSPTYWAYGTSTPIYIDQSALGGWCGQYHAGHLHFARIFPPCSQCVLGWSGSQGKLFFLNPPHWEIKPMTTSLVNHTHDHLDDRLVSEARSENKMHSLSLVFHKLAVHAVNKPVSAGCGRCEFDLSTSPKVF